ncbi:olfactory receptor 12D2-like [Bufo gargarizans]|uniref:olfactory receptor 12D2-like n=1 Tax=Bufo gargarizans TaxID=30331 RepID=UPI001CF1842A|nr:olfactory receptor 12D2-like [Bufo gargarizans]
MDPSNKTSLSDFILTGLTDVPWLQKLLFIFVLFFYQLGIMGNVIIIILAIRDPSLHSPMYFFLANLSFLDICFSSVTVPKMMVGFFWIQNVISIKACIVQMYFFHALGFSEGVLLSAMGYDRYVAICHPLRYRIIMRKSICFYIIFISWAAGLTTSLVNALMTSRLPFCNANRVRHFCCDVKPVIKLACKDIRVNQMTVTYFSGFICTGTFILTVLSYFYIISHLVTRHRSKAFSTCSAHLTVVLLFYGTAMCTYLGPDSEASIESDRIAAILFALITPSLNPVIYTLRNKDVQKSLRNMFSSSKY